MSLIKSISRRREKKGRLRRDVARGKTLSEKIKPCQTKVWRSQPAKSRDPPFAVLITKSLIKSVSRPREKKGRLRRDVAHGNTLSEKIKPCQTKVWRSQAYRAVARRRSAYAAMTTWIKNRAIVSGLAS